jgi:TRAP-type mannitol/chloroaromatic compound transport system substrate-binding protein
MLEIGSPWPSYYKGVVPEGELEGAVLGGLQTLQEVNTLFWKRGWADILRNEVYAPLGLYYLGNVPFGGYRITSRDPITSLDDIKGLKVRAVPPVSTLLDNLGAAVVSIPWGEQYTAMATGTIDAAVYGDFVDTVALKMHEFAPYHMDPPLASYTNAGFLVNMDAWNSLPEDLQHILQVAAWENARYSAIVVMDQTLGAWAEISAEGAKMTYLDPDDVPKLVAAEMELLDELGAASARMGKLVKIYKDFMTELGYL